MSMMPVEGNPIIAMQLSYIDPDGDTWELSDQLLSHGYICTGISGVAGIDSQFSSIPTLYGGAQPQMMTPQPGSVIMGMYAEMMNNDQNSYFDLLDKIAFAFMSIREGQPQPGYLIARRPDGTARKLAVYTTAGLSQQDASKDNDGIYWTTYAFGFNSPDPYWEDFDPQTIRYLLSSAGQTGILPLLPVKLNPSSTLGSSTVINDGGAESYPTWRITGPGLPTIRNNTTNRVWSLTQSVTAGQTIEVVTRPGKQSVMDIGSGTNMWDKLSFTTPRDLWSPARGRNDISLTVSGSTANTVVELDWTRRWLRA